MVKRVFPAKTQRKGKREKGKGKRDETRYLRLEAQGSEFVCVDL